MERSELLNEVRASQQAWDDLVASVPDDRMLEPVWEGGWNVKDICGHIGFYENWAAEFIRTERWADDDPILHHADIDTRNDAYHERNKHRALVDVLAELARIHAGMISAIEGLSEDDFRGRNQRGTPSANDARPIEQIVLGNTRDHFSEHAAEIRDWLAIS